MIINYNNYNSELPTGVRVGRAEVEFLLESLLQEGFTPQGLCTHASLGLIPSLPHLVIYGPPYTSFVTSLPQGSLLRFQDSILNALLVPIPSLQSTITRELNNDAHNFQKSTL